MKLLFDIHSSFELELNIGLLLDETDRSIWRAKEGMGQPKQPIKPSKEGKLPEETIFYLTIPHTVSPVLSVTHFV